MGHFLHEPNNKSRLTFRVMSLPAKEVKMFLGFEDVATKWFDSVIAHVRAIVEKQHRIRKIISSREKCHVTQMLTQFDGLQRFKNELRQTSKNQFVCPD